MRPLTPFMIEEMSRKTAELIDFIGHARFAREHSRLGTAELSKFKSPAEERMIPIDILTTAEIVAGNPIVSRYQLALQGFGLVPLAEADPVRRTSDMDVLGAAKEFGDVVAAWQMAVADGHVDALDKARLKKEIAELMAQLILMERGLGL